MARKYGVAGLLLVCIVLLGMQQAVCAASHGKSIFSDVENAMRAADRARETYQEHRSGRDAARYEREWYNREIRLEETRIERLSRETKASPREVHKMRENGRSWKEICNHFRIDDDRMGCGRKGSRGYDRDRDRDLQRYLYKKDRR